MREVFNPMGLMQAVYERMRREQLTVKEAAEAMRINRRTFYRVQFAAEQGEGYTRWNPTLERMRIWAQAPPRRKPAA